MDNLESELERLARLVLDVFGNEQDEAAVIRAAVVAKQHPDNPRTWNLALRDELRRLVGPH